MKVDHQIPSFIISINGETTLVTYCNQLKKCRFSGKLITPSKNVRNLQLFPTTTILHRRIQHQYGRRWTTLKSHKRPTTKGIPKAWSTFDSSSSTTDATDTFSKVSANQNLRLSRFKDRTTKKVCPYGPQDVNENNRLEALVELDWISLYTTWK